MPFPLVAVVVYGGVWAVLDTGFIAHWYPLPFLAEAGFLRRNSRLVGGPVESLAGLFTQTYSSHWAGVLAFTLLALAAWAIARGVLRRFSSGSWSWPAAALPLMALLLARSMSVVFILPMVAGLAAGWLYLVVRTTPRGDRAEAGLLVLFLLASIPLYWLLASGFLYFCAICALFELLVRKRRVSAAVWVAVAASVPYGMSYVLYEPDIAARYVRWTTVAQRDALTTGLAAAMYLFVPAGAVCAFVFGRFGRLSRLEPRLRPAVSAVGLAVLLLLAARLVAVRFDTSGWLYADYLREDGRPDEALASLTEAPNDSDPVRFLTFLTLSRAGRLPWEMFRHPQQASSDVLLLRDAAFDTHPAVFNWRSDLYLELGRVNDSQRWAHEALALEGETPRVLERLALTYVLNDNAETARTFVRALGKVPFQAASAGRFIEALERDASMGSDPLVARIRPLMLRRDYVGNWTTEQILQQCLDANPSNRTAFEYLLAHYLLTSDMNGLASLAPRLRSFYRELPTHVQEAALGFRNLNGTLPPGIDASAIDGRIESRFQRFFQIWTGRQHGPAADAWHALAPEFGDTWWFFFVFGRSAAGPPPTDAALSESGSQR